jgi:hypothetical protein
MTFQEAAANCAAVNAEVDEVLRSYEITRKAYHAMQIGDAEFMVARNAKEAALARFDVAFAIMQDVEPEAA